MITSILKVGSKWGRVIDGVSEVHPTAEGPYPPRTGWPTAVDLDYESNWIDDQGYLIARDYDNFINTINLDQKEMIRILKQGDEDFCHIVENSVYNQALEETEEWYDEGLDYIGDVDCSTHMEPVIVDGAVVIHDGDIVVTEV